MATAKNKRVLISGAGIGGLTTAYWFNQIGWEVVVLEKAPALRKGEFVIDFQGTGWDVAEAMQITDELRARETGIQALSFKDRHDVEKIHIKMDDFSDMVGVKGKMVSINRRELQNLLFDKVKNDVEIRFSSSATKIVEHESGVDVSINDGAAETFELVVGCDGLHSNIRQLVFGDESEFSRYLGYYVAAYNVKGLDAGAAHVMNILRQPNKQATYLDKGNGEGLAMYVFKSEKGEYVPSEKRAEVLKEAFAEMEGVIPAALDKITDETNIYMDTTTQIVMPKWYSKRVALVGDSAYCLTLVSGQGASMAMGGAYILAQEVKSSETIEQALENYDRRLRGFTEDLQNKTRKFASNFVPSSDFGLWVMDKAMSLINIPFIKSFASSQFNVESLFEVEKNGEK